MQLQSLQTSGLDLGLLLELGGGGNVGFLFVLFRFLDFFFEGYYPSLSVSILKPISVQGLALFVRVSQKKKKRR